MNAKKNKGFSLVELVIVVVIIGILAAIAIPRLSRGASGAGDSALHGNLKVLRTAIDLYASEHGGKYPPLADVTTQLTGFSDDALGAVLTKPANDTTHVYGPYLRAVPALPVSAKKGSTAIAAADGAGVGWLYNVDTGVITPNTGTEVDAKGVAYSSY
jgi:prepilin-type N-terminal cleavage/methylation domain-containing protein